MLAWVTPTGVEGGLEFNHGDFNANLNGNFNVAGMLQEVPTPKLQCQWEAVPMLMGGL